MIFIPCQLASPARDLPAGGEWIFEPKFDGFRLQMWVGDGKFQLFTRGGFDWTARLARFLPGSVCQTNDYVLDGEICALDSSGRPDFGLLGKALSDESVPLSFFAFDLLAVSGKSLNSLPLLARKGRLAEVISRLGIESVKLVPHTTDGRALNDSLKSTKWEGIMAKDRNSPYQPGVRSPAWRKVKFKKREEFIVAGWRQDEKTGFVKSIVLANMENGALTLRGSVGSGFSVLQRKELAVLFSEIGSVSTQSCQPFVDDGIQSLSPQFVADIEYLELSSGGCVRSASFKGLREDKAAADVQPEC